MAEPGPFRLLVVCAGNVCRSPAAELLLRPRLAPGGIEVGSAGLVAPQGAPVHPWTAEALAALGVDAGGHEARRLLPDHLQLADLVLVATRELRAETVQLWPPAVTRAWTLLEFVRHAEAAYGQLAAAAPLPDPGAPRLVALRDTASALRGTLPRVPPDADDLPDPITGGRADHQAVVARISVACDALVRVVGQDPAR
ncbi:MAG TPA: low molecular weight phosphatase family protein [Actinomycetes bacterium]|nr:low molecular weight phosphatase family protein [Actinomycetes bacterium]